MSAARPILENNPYALYEYANKKALELTRGYPREFNINPTIDLVKTAYLLGYDVTKFPSTWQPMATAPTDGTRILLAIHDNGDPANKMHVLIGWMQEGEWGREELGEWCECWPPSFWMPQPEPPTPSQKHD